MVCARKIFLSSQAIKTWFRMQFIETFDQDGLDFPPFILCASCGKAELLDIAIAANANRMHMRAIWVDSRLAQNAFARSSSGSDLFPSSDFADKRIKQVSKNRIRLCVASNSTNSSVKRVVDAWFDTPRKRHIQTCATAFEQLIQGRITSKHACRDAAMA
jgi:hypothetical protein